MKQAGKVENQGEIQDMPTFLVTNMIASNTRTPQKIQAVSNIRLASTINFTKHKHYNPSGGVLVVLG